MNQPVLGTPQARTTYLEALLDHLPQAVVVTDESDRIIEVYGAARSMTGRTESDLTGMLLASVLVVNPAAGALHDPATGDLLRADGDRLPVSVVASTIVRANGAPGIAYVIADVTERQRLEVELRHAQTLESIGQLAAGVAHEINTPVQFVSDSVDFLGEAMADLLTLVEHYRSARHVLAAEPGFRELAGRLEAHEDAADLEFVIDEAPRSLERTKEGLRRVAEIVRAMKQFSHPGGPALETSDLNELVETTLVVAKNEYKYVADVEISLGAIPPVSCDPRDISQVILNLVVNAAHAIEDNGAGERGRIVIATAASGEGVEVTVSDTGGGVPDDVRDRIFDPFFTTKEPGRGTGQGLALARSIVVDRHRGTLELDVEPWVGSTFRVWLPQEHHG